MRALPSADTSHIEVDEIGARIIAHSTRFQRKCRGTDGCQRALDVNQGRIGTTSEQKASRRLLHQWLDGEVELHAVHVLEVGDRYANKPYAPLDWINRANQSQTYLVERSP